MPQGRAMGNRPRSWRFALFAIIFGVATIDAVRSIGLERGLLAGFDVAAAIFLLASCTLFFKPASEMRLLAQANDASRVFRLVIGILLAVIIFAAMTAVIVDRASLSWFDKLLIAATVVLVWSFANAMYALHYAHLYYSRDRAGLAFPGTPEPLMADFAYFAFTIGVALQTADVSIGSRRIRRVVMTHEIVSFFFNVGVLALVINVLGAA